MEIQERKNVGQYLHQLLNHATMIRNYAEWFTAATNDKRIMMICRNLDNEITIGLSKLCGAISKKDLTEFADRKIINSTRMADLMRINELCSRLNDESIEIVANSLEEQLKPVLDAEFNANQTTIEYETNGK